MSAISSSDDVSVCTESGGTEEDISSNKKECTSCEQKNDEGATCKLLNGMSISDISDINTCANCGKEGSDVTNTCNKCKMVKYCNAGCKKKHRHKHKKECEEHLRLAAEHAAKLHDEALFRQPPPQEEDCPICFLRVPVLYSGHRYKSCCGKRICSGCIHAVRMRDGNVGLCPFCRTPAPTSSENIKMLRKRIDVGDAEMGSYFFFGEHGFTQNHAKALELYQRAGELGNAMAYNNIGACYNNGTGVEKDRKKAGHYFELAAMKGYSYARHNLGYLDEEAGNINRAMKHYMIAVGCGYTDSLNNIRCLFKDGHATKEEYTQALQSHQAYLNEVKSVQRDEAAAFDKKLKYY